MSALYKIPLILFLANDYKSIITPPQAPPPKEEILKSTAIDVPLVRKYRLAFTRSSHLFLAFVEISIIAAQAYPTTTLSKKILSILSHIAPNNKNQLNLNFSYLSLFAALTWLSGTRIRKWTFGELGRFFKFDISIQHDHKLITTGPYAFVRHPSYTGMLLANIGWLMWALAPGSWVRECGVLETPWGRAVLAAYVLVGIVPSLAVTLGRMHREDEALRRKFGGEWDEWFRRVPYAVLPGIY